MIDEKRLQSERQLCRSVFDRLKEAGARPLSVNTKEYAADRVFVVVFYAKPYNFGCVDQNTLDFVENVGFKIWKDKNGMPLRFKQPPNGTHDQDYDQITIQ